MRVNTINPCYSVKRNSTSPSFKAQVMIIPSCAEAGQPERDRVIMQKQTEDYKAKLQKAFPKDDNVMIVLQPSGYYSRDVKKYFSEIKEFIGYKDPERARVDILEMQDDLEDADKLEPHIVRALKNKEPEMMKRLAENKISHSTRLRDSDYITEIIDPYLVEAMDTTIALMEYRITEPPKEKQMLVEEKKSDMPLWFRVLFGDSGAPPIF